MRAPRLIVTGAAALALGTLAACGRDASRQQDALAQDSSLTRDLQLANRDTAAQPQLRDVATTTPPAAPAASNPAPAPAPASPPPAPRAAVRQRSSASTPAPRPERRVARAPTAPAPTAAPPVPPVTTTPSGNVVHERAATVAPGSTEGHIGVVAAGTSLALAAGQRVCTNTNTVGDRITASLSEAVTASNGVVIPAGATAVLEVTSLHPSNKAGQNSEIGLGVRSIMYGGKTYPVNGRIASAQTDQVKSASNNDAGKVLGGAAIGAILGNILGGRSRTRGTVIGAAGGAAAGAILAHQTARYDACIPAGGRILVQLNAPLSVQAAPAAATGAI